MDCAGESPGDGPKTRTAWAGVGDGALFRDAGGDGQITEGREVAVTEWDPTAKDDRTEPRVWGEVSELGRLRTRIHLAARSGRRGNASRS